MHVNHMLTTSIWTLQYMHFGFRTLQLTILSAAGCPLPAVSRTAAVCHPTPSPRHWTYKKRFKPDCASAAALMIKKRTGAIHYCRLQAAGTACSPEEPPALPRYIAPFKLSDI